MSTKKSAVFHLLEQRILALETFKCTNSCLLRHRRPLPIHAQFQKFLPAAVHGHGRGSYDFHHGRFVYLIVSPLLDPPGVHGGTSLDTPSWWRLPIQYSSKAPVWAYYLIADTDSSTALVPCKFSPAFMDHYDHSCCCSNTTVSPTVFIESRLAPHCPIEFTFWEECTLGRQGKEKLQAVASLLR